MRKICQLAHPRRILLIEPDERLRHTRANRLLSLGYRVSALADGDKLPVRFVPHLYDAVIIDAGDSSQVAFDFCKQGHRTCQPPAIAILADSHFQLDAPTVPAVIISEATEAATDEKLLAFLGSLSAVSVA